MRPAAATIAAILAIVAALAAAVLWTAGRDLLDEDRFADDVVAALASDPGQAAMSQRLSVLAAERLPAGTPAPVIEAAVGQAVARSAASPAFAEVLAPAAVLVHRRLADDPGAEAEIDLVALRDSLERELAEIDPLLVPGLPPASAFPSVGLSTGLDGPVLPGAELVGRVPVVVAALALLAAALAALALALSRRRARTARGIACALVVAAFVPPAIRVLAPRAADAAVDGSDDDLVRDLTGRLLGSWTGATVVLLAAAAALLVLAAVSSGEGPPNRRPAA
jgi:hypothetical protein